MLLQDASALVRTDSQAEVAHAEAQHWPRCVNLVLDGRPRRVHGAPSGPARWGGPYMPYVIPALAGGVHGQQATVARVPGAGLWLLCPDRLPFPDPSGAGERSRMGS